MISSEGSRALKSSLYLVAQFASAKAKGLDLIEFKVSRGFSQRQLRPNSTLKWKSEQARWVLFQAQTRERGMGLSSVKPVVSLRALPPSTAIILVEIGRGVKISWGGYSLSPQVVVHCQGWYP